MPHVPPTIGPANSDSRNQLAGRRHDDHARAAMPAREICHEITVSSTAH